jgi:hypothetical protein
MKPAVRVVIGLLLLIGALLLPVVPRLRSRAELKDRLIELEVMLEHGINSSDLIYCDRRIFPFYESRKSNFSAATSDSMIRLERSISNSIAFFDMLSRRSEFIDDKDKITMFLNHIHSNCQASIDSL